MASGGGALIGAAGDGLEGATQPSPHMPHLELHDHQLDKAHPPLTVPQDEALPDAARDEDDAMLQTGLREAARIARETKEHGRKRKMSPKEGPRSEEHAKETTEGLRQELKLVEDPEETTGRCTLGRRRSKKGKTDFHSLNTRKRRSEG